MFRTFKIECTVCGGEMKTGGESEEMTWSVNKVNVFGGIISENGHPFITSKTKTGSAIGPVCV